VGSEYSFGSDLVSVKDALIIVPYDNGIFLHWMNSQNSMNFDISLQDLLKSRTLPEVYFGVLAFHVDINNQKRRMAHESF